jgi:multidrug resistance efflux pump
VGSKNEGVTFDYFMNFNSKFFRRALGIFILVGLLIVIVPATLKLQSNDAIVNAKSIPIHAPIEGVVAESMMIAGQSVLKGQAVLSILNTRVNDSLVRSLKVEYSTLENRSQGLEDQLAQLTVLQEDLTKRRLAHASHDLKRIDLQIAEAAAQVLAQSSVVDELRLTREKNARLLAENFISSIEFERSNYGLEVGLADLQAIQAKLALLQSQKQASSEGVYLGEGRNDVPYTQQKLDEINTRLIELMGLQRETLGRLAAVQMQLELELKSLSRLSEASLLSPVDGVVWRQFYSPGSEVNDGTKVAELIDCTRLFVEVGVNDSVLHQFRVGTDVQFRLVGSAKWLQGKVTQAIGGGYQNVDLTLAAHLVVNKDQGRLLIEIAADALEQVHENLCFIGRRVEVSLDRPWNFNVLWSRFSNLFS